MEADMNNCPATLSEASEAAIENNELAKRYVRFCASMIDLFLLIVLSVAMLFLTFTLFDIFNYAGLFRRPFTELEGVLIVPLTLFLPSIVAPVLFAKINFRLLRTSGQTLGKFVFKIRMTRSNGTPAGVWRILFRRYLVMYILFLIIILSHYLYASFALASLLPIFSKPRRCLHDFIADTIVVKA